MPEVTTATGEVREFPYDKKGIKAAQDLEAEQRALAVASAPKNPTQADVNESIGILATEVEPYEAPQDPYDLAHSKAVLKNATPEQIAKARDALGVPKGMNMGGVVVDELGYMKGGMSYSKRQPVKYSAGGAVRGKNFAGTF
jgi:hypothetical protein